MIDRVAMTFSITEMGALQSRLEPLGSKLSTSRTPQPWGTLAMIVGSVGNHSILVEPPSDLE